jgi:hypothetical protein
VTEALLPAEAWGGPFDGRVIDPGIRSLIVYQGKNTGAVSLGVPFQGGRVIGEYVGFAGRSGGVVFWREAGR